MTWILITLNFLVCVIGSWICTKVQEQQYPAPSTFIVGIATMILWSALVRYTHLSLVALSAWFDVATALGYFFGYALWGVTITPVQWLGILFLVVGLILVNH